VYSDTHCHLSHLVERGVDLGSLFADLAREGYRLALDIGTKPGDLAGRIERVREGASRSGIDHDGAGLPSFAHFTCGLWPDGSVIADRWEALRLLAADIARMKGLAAERFETAGVTLMALGECGLDRYWNGKEAPGRLQALAAAAAGKGTDGDDGPGTEDLAGEEELFAMQLELARKENLAVIVHSREAFEATEGILRNSGASRGVIHCWSYGIDEARAFLDLGYYISFPGNVTWPKRETDREDIARMLRFVPRDRLLLETDAPYLTPAPHRGKVNTPYLVRHVYDRAGEILGMTGEVLSALVWENSRVLFGA